MEYESKEAYLWSVLPLSGITSNYSNSGTFTSFPEATNRSVKLYGIPYNPNDSLKVMNFTTSTLNGPILTNGPLLYTFSMEAIYRVKWKIPTNQKLNVGFYTTDYISTVKESSKFYLFGTSKGVSLFNDCQGEFSFTGFGMFCVIVQGNVPFEMKISYSNPKSVTIPSLKLYLPIPFSIFCNSLIMTQELIDEANQNILLKPLPNYIAKTNVMLDFLNAMAVTLIFNPTTQLLQNKLSAISTNTYKNLPFVNGNSSIFTLSASLNDVKDYYLGFNNNIALKTPLKPGQNLISTIKISLTIVGTIETPTPTNTITNKIVSANFDNVTFVYGKPEASGLFSNYSFRNKVCSFKFPNFTLTQGNTTTVKFSTITIIQANVDCIGLCAHIGDIEEIDNTTKASSNYYEASLAKLSITADIIDITYQTS